MWVKENQHIVFMNSGPCYDCCINHYFLHKNEQIFYNSKTNVWHILKRSFPKKISILKKGRIKKIRVISARIISCVLILMKYTYTSRNFQK